MSLPSSETDARSRAVDGRLLPRSSTCPTARPVRTTTSSSSARSLSTALRCGSPLSRARKNLCRLTLRQANVNAGMYASPEAFDHDLHHLFSIAKLFIRPDSPGTVYSDLLVLQVRPGPLARLVHVPALTWPSFRSSHSGSTRSSRSRSVPPSAPLSSTTRRRSRQLAEGRATCSTPRATSLPLAPT